MNHKKCPKVWVCSQFSEKGNLELATLGFLTSSQNGERNTWRCSQHPETVVVSGFVKAKVLMRFCSFLREWLVAGMSKVGRDKVGIVKLRVWMRPSNLGPKSRAIFWWSRPQLLTQNNTWEPAVFPFISRYVCKKSALTSHLYARNIPLEIRDHG